jgi:hypothetical protein
MKIIKLGNPKPKQYEPDAESGSPRLREAEWTGPECITEIRVSPASTTLQALSEIRRCWEWAGHGKPSWVSGTDAPLTALVAEDLGAPITEYQE